jgi:hypothetical protein
MWAMEMRVDKRPQTAADFVQAMRGARSATANGSAKGPTATHQAAPNPYQGRIDQLLAEMESVPDPPPVSVAISTQGGTQSALDPRIHEINGQLERIGFTLQLRLEDCPCCLQATLGRVEVQKSPLCPVCTGAQMRVKKLDQKLCPVCREGHIGPTELKSQLMFCPICRSRSLREEKRKRFGLAIDMWWVCPGCSAEFDVLMGGRAKLVSAGTDPLGAGKGHLGETLPVAAWQLLAPLSKACWTCDQCAAQFYELSDSRLSLDWVERDPHGVKEKLLGKTYFRTVWAKIANGLSASVGNTHCPACDANFDYDQVDKKLKVLDCDRGRFPRAIPFLGQSHDLETWSLFAAGKNSLSPGWLCSSCHAEFDELGSEMELVAGPPQHSNAVGQSRSFGNWHRLARSLPSEEEEADLRTELTGLDSEKRKELARLLHAEQERQAAIEKKLRERRSGIEKQLQALVKQSFIGGFITLGLQSASIGLRKSEGVVWETPACRLKQRTSNGVPFWDTDGVGVLVVTDQRVIFRANNGAMWSKPVAKLLSANHEYLGDQGMCVVWIDGQQKPVAFVAADATGTYSIADITVSIQLTSHDLREVLQGRCGG